jgi:SAM-dependent methyltransferase
MSDLERAWECLRKGEYAAARDLLLSEADPDLQASDLRVLNLLGEANRHIAQEGREVERCEVFLCGNVGTYRRYARNLPRAEDIVIELGCADGQTTRYLARRAALVVAVDSAPAVIAAARERNQGRGNIHFVAADADEVGRVAAVAGAADLLFVDVGGSSPPWIGYKLARQYRDMFLPRAVVLRSKELNDFVRAVTAVDEEAKLDTWTDRVPPLWNR